MTEANKTRVLFICLGNICRSPMAALVMKHLVKERGITDKWEIDSAALGSWHVGGSGDSRMKVTLRKHEMDCTHTVFLISARFCA